MINKISNLISKNEGTMIIWFFLEIFSFFSAGYSFREGEILESFILMFLGIGIAFIVGEAIKLRGIKIGEQRTKT